MYNIASMTEKNWDVIIVGGGMTGVAAAVCARRNGCENVLLVEKAGYFGGAAATCLINPFMSYWTSTPDNDHFLLSDGFFTEMRKILEEIGAYKENNHEVLHEEYLKIAFDRLILKEGITPLFHAMLSGVEKEGETIKSVSFATKAGTLTFRGSCFIDCTGDGDLAFQAGCPFHLGREDGLCQPMTLCFRIGNIDLEKFQENRQLLQQKYKELQAEGKIKNPRENVLIFSTLVDGMLHFNTTRVIKHDPTNPFDVTEAEMIARDQMLEMYNFLKENCPGFENSQLLYSASEIGVRESRMIEGEYLLNTDDLKNCVKFEDSICAGNYDIDIHNPEGSGTSHYYFPAGIWYTIPYRCLQPLKASNLLVAGRCISSTHEAQASYRIMPIVTTLGEAAGVAAALAVKYRVGVKQIPVTELQEILRANGAFLG